MQTLAGSTRDFVPCWSGALSDASVGQRKSLCAFCYCHFIVVSHLVNAKFVLSSRRRRPLLEDHSPRQAVVSLQDTPVLLVLAMTHLSRHSFVVPILAAPLSTDTRRSTVGPGTREDTVPSFWCVRSARVRGEVHRVRRQWPNTSRQRYRVSFTNARVVRYIVVEPSVLDLPAPVLECIETALVVLYVTPALTVYRVRKKSVTEGGGLEASAVCAEYFSAALEVSAARVRWVDTSHWLLQCSQRLHLWLSLPQ